MSSISNSEIRVFVLKRVGLAADVCLGDVVDLTVVAPPVLCSDRPFSPIIIPKKCCTQ